jgi:hypothetical protein
MPHKKKSRRFLTPLVLFTLAGWALWMLGRNEQAETDSPEPSTTSQARPRATWSKRRLATSLAFATLFFGGAAFSAGAGDVVAEALEGSETATEVASTEEAPAEEAPAEEAAPTEEEPAEGGEEAPAEGGEEAPAEGGEQPADGGDQPAEGGGEPAEGGVEEPAEGGNEPAEGGNEPAEGGEEPAGDGEPVPPSPLPDAPGGGDDGPEAPKPSPGVGDGPGNDPAPPSLPVIDKETRSPAHLDPEAQAVGFFATIWLHRPLPDPTPPAKRLNSAFARGLARESTRARVDWALVLGVLRARGFDGTSLSLRTVRTTARRLADLGARRHPVTALRAYGGREFGDEAFALRNYNRAVGLPALVRGFEASKRELQRAVLRDARLDIYPGGRLDVAMGRTDVRVLVLLRYLAESHGQATVSSLTTGHRFYSRPGVVSAHSYGLAVDVAALANTSIYGNQQPGGVTERGVENILRLPSELQPKQVISLLSMGGPSFAMADHHDHIHVGY